MDFVERLQQILDSKGITPYKLCKDIGIATNSLNNWKGGSFPTIDKYRKIVLYLDIEPGLLLNIDNTKIEFTYDEKELVEYYRKLPEHEKSRELGRLEAKSEQYRNQDESSSSRTG